MNFLRQIKLILWKNFLLRKRQKIRCVVELVWPLILFAILMWVRTRGLKKYIHECHFEEKAMPSAGLLPFLQGFVCTLNNTCHRNVPDSRAALEKLNTSSVWRLLEGMEGVLEKRVGRGDVSNLEAASGDLMQLAQLIQSIVAKEHHVQGTLELGTLIKDPRVLKQNLWKENIQLSREVVDGLLSSHLALQNFTLSQLTSLRNDPKVLVCDHNLLNEVLTLPRSLKVTQVSQELCALPTSNFSFLAQEITQQLQASKLWEEMLRYVELNLGRELSWTEWTQLRQLSTQLSKDVETLSEFQDLLDEVGNTARQFTPARLMDSNATANTANKSDLSPGIISATALIQNVLCGPNTTNIIDQIAAGGGESTRYDELRDQLKNSKAQYEEYINDTDATPECNELFRSLESNGLARLIWTQVKPFIRGKIVYAPNVPAVDRVMSRVNDSFAFIERMHSTVSMFATSALPRLRELLINQTAVLKIIQEGWPRALSTLQRFLGNETNSPLSTLEQFVNKFLEGNRTELRETTLDMLEDLQANITTYLECFDVNKVEGYATEAEAVERGMELLENKKLWAVVSFVDLEDTTENSTLELLPPFVSYKIRMDSARVDSTKRVEDMLRRPGPRRRPGIDMKYITYGFAYLQDLVDSSIIREHTKRERTPGIFLQQFPYPCHIIDQFTLAISRTFPLFMVLSWVYTSAMIIKSIVYEKERRLKETMRVMGLGNSVHWIGWFVDSMTPMIFTIFLLTLILVFGKVLENSDPTLVFCFLLVYSITTVIKSFLISVFFSKANLAAAAGGIIFFVLYLPYGFIVLWEEKMSPFLKGLACLLSNVSFGFGCSYLSYFEEMGVGAQWHNYYRSPLLNDKLSLQGCMHMLMLDAVIYATLTWYIEAVFPGDYGVPKPWYFPFLKSYWCGTEPPKDSDITKEPTLLPENVEKENFESDPSHLPVGVSLHNLGKTYGNGKVALTNLSLNFYQGQITAFLGHNGAGKTTTISILTGLFPPSRGTATINGLDIRRDMDSIRGSLGTCPQHNVLFDQLSVEEHLWFYALIKGRAREEVQAETDRMIVDLGLPHKKHEMAKNLSGGMQRKLSIAVAFVGGSKTVILDEPTSGVDPFSRRSIWELLVKYKKDRTVILTTHFMDEADLLADRIAIIAGGSLRCCGSGLFLKARFGSGFYLTVEQATRLSHSVTTSPVHENGKIKNGFVNGNKPSDVQISARVREISDVVSSCVANAALLEAVGQELVFSLPFSLQNRPGALSALQCLLDTLDAQGPALGINSYGISDTSLEEIFLKVAEEQSEQHQEVQKPASRVNGTISKKSEICEETLDLHELKSPSNGNVVDSSLAPLESSYPVSQQQIIVQVRGSNVKYMKASSGETSEEMTQNWETARGRRKLRWIQFMALQTKRFNHTKRDPKALFCEIVLPALFVCLALAFTLIVPGLEAEPPLELKPWIYPPPNHVFFENQAPSSVWAQKYQNNLLGPFGMGTKCVGPKYGSCSTPESEFDLSYGENVSVPSVSPHCSCARGTQKCPVGAGGPQPPRQQVATGDMLLNMTGRNISDWIVKTEEKYYKVRYGGFSLGIHNPLSELNMSRLVMQLSRLDRASNLGDERFPEYDNLSVTLTQRTQEQDFFDNIKVWYNNKGWAASVSYMNALSNVILRASLQPEQQPHNFGIRTINHPMNFTPTQLSQEMIKQSGISLLHAISVIFAMSFVPASFVVLLIEERASKAKHLQFVSGVDANVYWFAAFCWDMFSYLVSATLCIFIFLMFDEKAYVSKENLPGLVLLLVLYGWSSIPLMYPASFIASVPSSAFVFLACANLFVGIVTTVATFVLEIFPDEELNFIASILKEVFLIFPHFCLGQGLMKMATYHLAEQQFASFGLEVKNNIFEWQFLGKNLLAMTLEGFIFFAFTLALQHGVFAPYWQKIINAVQSTPVSRPCECGDEEEADVAVERERVSQAQEDDVLRLCDLCKVYKPGTRPAVDKLCFGVHKAECFGLLGLNGAGKTSTFKMLTGDTKATSGDAYVCSHSVQHALPLVRRNLGYCPQFDALDPLLTAREHLEFYSKLRGVPSHLLPMAVDEGLCRLGLIPYADRCAGTYSGGNKRKLSTAIALVGNPPLVFLDEPTSGMDPAARRFLWRCILRTVKEGRSVVLTSHSMEECQALCSRLTVMVNGRMACLGSAQHLKSKFGNGYTLVVRCPVDQVAAVEAHMKVHLPEAELSESHHTRLRFQLPSGSNKLSAALGALEEARAAHLLYDYSVSQTTLEEVFLRFANQQSDLSIDEDWATCSCFKALLAHRRRMQARSVEQV